MKAIITVLCISFLTTPTTATKATISIECGGEHQYVDDNGRCRNCEKCPPGTQIHGGCGYGKRDYDYTCVECSADHYTETAGYNICVVCAPCQTWNTVYVVECTPTQNSVCGACMHGFYRKNLRGEADLPDEVCLPCSQLTKDQPECMDSGDFPLTTVAVVGWVAFCLMVILVGIGYLCHRKRRKSTKKRQRYDTSSPMNESQSIGDSRSELSVVEMDPLKPNYPIVTSYIDEGAQLGKVEATTPFLPLFRAGYHDHPPSEHYSNMPTAQFGATTSNLPTTLYDETHPSQLNNAVSLSHHNNAITIPQSGRVGIDFTNPHPHLVGHNVSDSKPFGPQQTPEPFFEPESFDTRSVAGETTRPHKI